MGGSGVAVVASPVTFRDHIEPSWPSSAILLPGLATRVVAAAKLDVGSAADGVQSPHPAGPVINILMPCRLHPTLLIAGQVRGCVRARSVVAGFSNRPELVKCVVQHGSTATGADGGRFGWTLWDADLRGWTRVDVLPVVCKQGVRGSSPLSSTGQKQKSNNRGASTAGKYSSSTHLRTRTDVRIGPFLAGGNCGPGQRIPGAQPAPCR